MSVVIRCAVPEDAAAIVGIYAPYVLETGVTFETEVPTVEEYRQRILRIQQFYPFFVLEEDGAVVAYACAHAYHERKAYQWMCETTIYVRQDRHRCGYARMLYEKLLAALKRQGLCEAIAILGCPNIPSEKFHASMGFALTATFEKMGYKLDRWYDVKFYNLELNSRKEAPAEPVPYDGRI